MKFWLLCAVLLLGACEGVSYDLDGVSLADAGAERDSTADAGRDIATGDASVDARAADSDSASPDSTTSDADATSSDAEATGDAGDAANLPDVADASDASDTSDASDASDAMDAGGPTPLWIDISTGDTHSCAVARDGKAYCWGYGGSGRLGTGSASQQLLPAPVLSNALFVDIEAGGDHTCALSQNRDLYCWGYGGNIGTPADQFVPILIAAGPFKQLSTGYDVVCVIDEMDYVKCLGENDTGQLGIVDPADQTQLVDLGGTPLQALDVSAGWEFTCALDLQGQTTCWGRDLATDKQAENDGAAVNLTQPISQLLPLVDIEAGNSHVCGHDAMDNTYCWGYSGLVNDLTGGGGPTTAGFLATPLAFTGVASGDHFSCAPEADGTVWCWGSNYRGRQGAGTDNSGGGTEGPQLLATSSKFTKIDVDHQHGCGITTDDQLLCWGQAWNGRLGNGEDGLSLVPIPVQSTVSFVQAAGADYHSCALSDTGSIYCFGRGSYSALGTGSFAHERVPAEVTGLTFTNVRAAGSHTCGLTTGATIQCWGDDMDGVLGNGSAGATNSPDLVQGTEPFVFQDTGHDFGCGIYTSGPTVCWGEDLDIASTSGNNHSTPIPLNPMDHPAFVSVATGWSHSCGFDAAGAAWCWGLNSDGQLGNGTTSSSRLVSVPVSGGLTFKEIDVGANFSCAIDSLDDAYCWGAGSRRGDGSGSDRSTPQLVSGGHKWSTLSSYAESTCGVTLTGDVLCWGEGNSGRLGDGSTSDRNTPVQAVLGEPAVHVGVGGAHACAAGASGQLYCWGSEEFGRLGNDKDSIYRFPTPVDVSGVTIN